jgi:hypothetical protein
MSDFALRNEEIGRQRELIRAIRSWGAEFALDKGQSASPEAQAAQKGGPLVAQASQAEALDYSTVLRAITPDALAFGISTGVLPPGIPGFLAPFGHFALYNPTTGGVGSFSARPVKALPDIPTPNGPIKHGFSIVGTIGQTPNGVTDQAGFGWSAKIPTPAGDGLLFANIRQDYATVGNMIQDREGRHVVNATIGVGYSVSDGAANLLAAKLPKVGIPVSAALNASGTDVWGGGAYAGQIVFQDGVPQAIILSGVEIPLDRVASLFGDEIESRAMTGGYSPDALNRSILRNFDPLHTNVTELGIQYQRVIERGFERGLTDPEEQYLAMTRALADPAKAFPELPPEGRKAAAMVINSVLGRQDAAERLAAELYPHDNMHDGMRPRGLSAMRVRSLAELDR